MKKSAIVYALKNKKGEYYKRSGNFDKGLDNLAIWEKPWNKESLKGGETMEQIKRTWKA